MSRYQGRQSFSVADEAMVVTAMLPDEVKNGRD